MEKKALNGKSWIIIGAVVVLLAVLGVVGFSIARGGADRKENLLELGQRYLDELDYEQAAVCFEKYLEIDSKNIEAYLGLAEAYVGMDNLEKARKVLAEGYAQTQSERIVKLQEELAQSDRDISKGNLVGEYIPQNQENKKAENEPVEQPSQAEPTVIFVPWVMAGLEDHVMDWQDENLEALMRETTGIIDGDIMLSDVWSLKSLEMEAKNANTIKNISALSELTNLTELELPCGLQDISPLSSLTNLTYLYLENNQISDISVLSNLTNLKSLTLYSNQISDISALSSLTYLKRLDLEMNQISDISVLSNLTSLTSLRLGNNQISDISALSGLISLEDLDLSSNLISDISVLSGLTNLTHLNLSQNPIIDYSVVEFVEHNGGYVNY